MGAGGATRLTKRHKTPRRKLSSSSRLILPSSQAVASAVTMFPRSIAVAKIRRGCPLRCHSPFPVGPDSVCKLTRKWSAVAVPRSRTPGA